MRKRKYHVVALTNRGISLNSSSYTYEDALNILINLNNYSSQPDFKIIDEKTLRRLEDRYHTVEETHELVINNFKLLQRQLRLKMHLE